MKKIIFFVLLLAFFGACEENEKIFNIEGEFENLAGDTLFLYRLNNINSELIDSVIVDEDGKFVIKNEVSQPEFMTIGKTYPPRIYLIVHPKEKIKLSGDWNKIPEEYNVSGSKDSELIKEQSDHLYKTKYKLMELNIMINSAQNIIERDSIKQVAAKKYFEIIEAEHDYTIKYIQDNINSLACYFALSRPVDKTRNAMNFAKDLKYYKMIDSSLSLKYPDHPQVKVLKRFIKNSEEKLKNTQTKKNLLGIGDEAHDIKLPSPNGDSIALSSLRGKYVLLDFWASWCRPCRVENPNLVENYQKYRSKGFEIYQVSLDKTKEDWTEAIQTDNLDWVHVSDLKHWHCAPAKLYKIKSIPSSFLLDKEGKIIAINLRGAALGKKLQDIFEEKE